MSYATHPRMARRGTLAKGLAAFSALLVASLVLAASASAATTLSATVNGTGQGTPGAPVPVIATLTTVIDNNGATPPAPVAQTATIAETFPGEFVNELAKFGSCPQSNFDATGEVPGGPEDPSVSCPANSLVGNGLLKNYAAVPGGTPPPFVAQSDKVVIVKNATTGGLSFWISFEPIPGSRTSKILPGTVTTNASGQTVITWDPTGVEAAPFIKLLEWQVSYNSNQAGLVTPEPFANTGCSSGTWAFSSTVTFVGGAVPSQTANASADCKNLTAPLEGVQSIASSSAKVSSKGNGKFKVKCSSVGACKGTYKMRVTWPKTKKKVVIAKGSYSLVAGQTLNVSFKLTGKGKKLLASKNGGTLKTKLTLTSSEGKSVNRTFKLKAK